MNLPTQDSATGRAGKTFLQTIVGIITGLFIAVWAVPGVPQVVTNYLTDNLLTIFLIVGIPSGLFSFLMNFLRKDVKNY